jgi:outer membrane protein assembly factor BamD
MKMMMKLYWPMVVLMALGVLVGCAQKKDNKLLHQGKSPKYLYALAHNKLKNEEYSQAIELYKSLNAQYPFQHYSRKGTLELIYAYYKADKSARALALAEQFTKLYPQHEHAGYAYYIMGVINYNNNRGFLETYFPYQMDQHATTPYRTSFNQLKKAVQLNPEADYVNDARRRMIHLKNVIADYQYNIAKFYYSRQAYVGTINRAQKVVKNNPKTQPVEKTLVLMARAYQKLGLDQPAKKTAKVLKLNFPDNDYLKESD